MKAYIVIQAIKEAIKRMKSEESRRRVIMMICLLFFLAFYCMGMLVYVVSTPMSALASLFVGTTINIRELKRNPALIQYSATENYDAIHYEGNTVIQGGKTITYYNQLDKPWKDMLYGFSATIGHSGCGPTSMAIVISTLLGQDMTPAQMADWSYDKGYLVQYYDSKGEHHASTSHSFIPAAAAANDLICTGISKGASARELLTEALAEGKYVVAIMGPGNFTKGGHFIVLSGITEDGRILVVDCASRSRTALAWDPDLIIDEARSGAGAGGPFWAISVPPPPVEEEIEDQEGKNGDKEEKEQVDNKKETDTKSDKKETSGKKSSKGKKVQLINVNSENRKY